MGRLHNEFRPDHPYDAYDDLAFSLVAGFCALAIDSFAIKYMPNLVRENPQAAGSIILIASGVTGSCGFFWQKAQNSFDRFHDKRKS